MCVCVCVCVCTFILFHTFQIIKYQAVKNKQKLHNWHFWLSNERKAKCATDYSTFLDLVSVTIFYWIKLAFIKYNIYLAWVSYWEVFGKTQPFIIYSNELYSYVHKCTKYRNYQSCYAGSQGCFKNTEVWRVWYIVFLAPPLVDDTPSARLTSLNRQSRLAWPSLWPVLCSQHPDTSTCVCANTVLSGIWLFSPTSAVAVSFCPPTGVWTIAMCNEGVRTAHGAYFLQHAPKCVSFYVG